jgi:DNA-binding SARP family transcriptional activator
VDAVKPGIARIPRPVLASRLADALDAGSALLVAGAGYGKTMALEDASEVLGRRAVWVACGDAGGEAARLLIAIVQELKAVMPGLADVALDRLAAGLERLDAESATTPLLLDLESLLVEPLVIVFDDAEQLDGADESLAIVERLLNLRTAPVSVAIATRHPLPLKLTKLRAAGRLLELGPADLSFTAGECEELLRLRAGRDVTEEEVTAAIAASEGWPMGVALTGLTGRDESNPGLVPRDDLFDYLAEEVLDRLDPATRMNLVDSSVPDTLSPELLGDLGLPPDFLAEAERSALFLRTHASGAYSYHPLFRAFLRERLRELRTEEERAALHARAAQSLTGTGRQAEAIEHWLEAGLFAEALGALATHGTGLLRTSPGTVESWLAALPEELHEQPDYLLLKGQLVAGAGQHEPALEPLRAAAAGFHATGNEDREWIARLFIADALLFLGDFGEVSPLAEGWESASGPIAAAAAMAVAWYEAVALASGGWNDEAEELRERLIDDPAAPQFGFLDVLLLAGIEFTGGQPRPAIARLDAAIAELELDDPFGRLPYVLGMELVMLRTLGERARALAWLDRCELESERTGLGWARRDFRLQRASLLAQAGDLSRAEVELAAAGKRTGGGWRAVYQAEAEAHVAMLRGDARVAVAAAQRALEASAPGPILWRAVATIELADVFVEAGNVGAAHAAIDATLADHDARYPEQRGRLLRAWLLAARASLQFKTGEPDAACGSIRDAWEVAGSEAGEMVRAQWPAVKPVFWHALAEGAIAPDDVLPAVQETFPGALVAMADHPDPAVRRAALSTALAAGHPAVLARLAELAKDADAQVASAAAAAQERLRSDPPPLRFELLGGFRVRRAGWELDGAAWGRPMAARVVRFLLAQGEGAVPEDTLFEAFWADRTADTARQHLTVAVSRARKVLDLPGAEESVIETRERTYRLRLRERDGVDSAGFESAAAGALAAHGRDRRTALERAAELWTGEPLPEDRYAPWSFAWRERLTETYSQVLGALIEGYESSGEHDHSIRAAQRLLEVDPLNEHAHRRLMTAYARTGRTSYALRQFLECRRALVVELGVEPSAETSQLQARILAGGPV